MQDKKTLKARLGKRVLALRKKRGWNQEEFAHKSQIARSFAGAIERGEKDVRLSTLCKLAAGFEMSLASFIKDIEK